jgi:hypothetical protein
MKIFFSPSYKNSPLTADRQTLQILVNFKLHDFLGIRLLLKAIGD